MSTDQREVLTAVLAANLAAVFSEAGTEDVVKVVLDAPMAANDACQELRFRRVTRDEIGTGGGKVVLLRADPRHLDDAPDVSLWRVDVFGPLAEQHRSHNAPFTASVLIVARLVRGQRTDRSGLETGSDVLVEQWLVAFGGGDE